MQRAHARLAPTEGDDEEEAAEDHASDAHSEQQLLQGSGRAGDDERGGEGESEEGDDAYEGRSGDPSDGEQSLGMSARDEDAIESSSFWDADDAFVPLPPLPQGTQEDHSIIDVLAEELLQREIPEYMEAFEIVIPDSEIVVGSVPVEEIQQRELDVEEAKVRHAELESELYRQRETQLTKQEAFARTRLLDEARKRQQALARERLQFVEAMQLRTRRLGYVFQQAESHLKTELERQQARVQRVYGDLVHSRVPQSRKRYRVEWQKIPVTIQIRVKMLSALKDKLPGGHYVLVATLYDRLGGHALHWSAWDPEYAGNQARRKADARKHKEKCHKQSDESDPETVGGGGSSSLATGGNQIPLGKPNFTRPFHHRGRFYSTEVVVNQNVYLVCPPECALRPGNVLIFELFHLSSAHNNSSNGGGGRGQHQQQQHDDQVVAWGAMPLSTPDFACIQGKFKIPLLRGEMDSTIDKFRDIEQLYQDDLSSWLCNLYFKVSHLEKRMPPPLSVQGSGRDRGTARRPAGANDDDFDVEIDESSGLYRLENNHQRYMRKLTTKHIRMGRSGRNLLLRDEDGQEKSDLGSTSSGHSQLRTRRMVAGRSDARLEGVDEDLKLSAKGNDAGGTAVGSYPSSRTLLLEDPSEAGDEQQQQRQRVKRKASSKQTSSSVSPVFSSLRRIWKRFTAPKKTRVYSGEMVEKKRYELQVRAAGDNSKAPTVHQSSHSHVYQDGHGDLDDDDDEGGDSSSSNADEDENEATDGTKPNTLDVDNYTFSANAASSVETAHHKRFHMQRKLYYLRHELLVDLSASNFKTLEFWRLVSLLLFTLWVRVYVHYVMQWVFLRGNRIPVYDFRPQWTTCLVKYTWRTIATSTEIGVIVFGVLGNVLLFGFFALCAAVGQRFVGELPHFASSFIVCVGLATVLDPYLVLVADVLSHHYGCANFSPDCLESLASSKCKCVEGDAFKLYVRFLAQEGSGLVGIIMTLIIYAALTCVSLVCVYTYMLHVHMNGRMLDVYRRVHGQEDDFFVPHDGEIGLPDLRAICEQARRWKGPRGAQRKVFVHEYTLTDPLDPSFEEKSVHVAVYTMELDGARELHRHFLKSHDGAVIELFGEIGAGTGGAWLHGAHSATSLALLYNIIQDQQSHEQTGEASAEHLTQLLDAL